MRKSPVVENEDLRRPNGSYSSVDGRASGLAQAAPTGLLGRLLGQFGLPTGILGHLAGYLMARSDADDRWVVDLLDVRPDDRVLEVGYGPGLTVKLIAERATAGFVAGVDPSEVMLRQASRRNRRAIESGRVELRLGVAAELPYPDAYFTKACAIHTLYFWPSLEDGLREIHRVLAPNGLLVLAVRMQRADAGRMDPSRYGLTDEQVGDIVATLHTVGFGGVTTARRDVDRQTITAIVARR